jgi:hypothetical protein
MNIKQMIDKAHGPQYENELVEEALNKYPEAKRIAVENFVMSAPDEPATNRYNLLMDKKLYNWNWDTFYAIEDCLSNLGKY